MDSKHLVGLVGAVVAYLCGGAAIFRSIEGAHELTRRGQLKRFVETFLENNTCIDQKDLGNFLRKVASDEEFVQRILEENELAIQWDFSGSFCFAVTVVTTIGYGNLAPNTGLGKVVCVAYALIGIPLIMLMLSALGQKLKNLSNRIGQLNLCSKRPTVNKIINMFIILALGFSFLFVAPAFVFAHVERWTPIEALYFCFITLSTIGFGDYIAAIHGSELADEAAGNLYKIAAYTWILFGLAYLSLIINYISGVLATKAETVQKKTEQLGKIRTEISGKLQRELINTTNSVKKADPINAFVRRVAGQRAPQSEDKNDGGVKLLRFWRNGNCRVEPLES